MTANRKLIHTAALFAAPIVVAVWGFSVLGAIGLVILLLLWRWLIAMSGFVAPEKTAELELHSITASHFVEKVRWAMDRLGLEYAEKQAAGTLGAFYLGRTVPLLKMRTGAVRSEIGNSTEILRYLWGRYASDDPDRAAFLQPTPERMELERTFDRLGVSLQIWIYYRILDHESLVLRAWGIDSPDIPYWQRQLLRLVRPIQSVLIRKSFRINDKSFARSVANIEEVLADANARLSDDSQSLLGESAPNYADFAFAAMTGLWLMPEGYGGGKAESIRISRDEMPEAMRKDVEAWEAANPRAIAFVQRLYKEFRHAE